MVSAESISLIEVEILKWKKRGITNSFIALILFMVLFVGCHRLGYVVWSNVLIPQLKVMSHPTFIILFGCLAHTLTALISLMLYLPAYIDKTSWLNKYRINVQIVGCRERAHGHGSELTGGQFLQKLYFTCLWCILYISRSVCTLALSTRNCALRGFQACNEPCDLANSMSLK